MSRIICWSMLAVVAMFAAACGFGSGENSPFGSSIKSGSVGNNLTVSLSNKDGVLRHGKQTFMLTFSDASGKPVDVGAVAVNFFMPAMGSMPAMNDAATLTTTETPGVYAGDVTLQMSGEWQVQISYDGAAGKGKASLPITAQ